MLMEWMLAAYEVGLNVVRQEVVCNYIEVLRDEVGLDVVGLDEVGDEVELNVGRVEEMVEKVGYLSVWKLWAVMLD